MQSWQFEIFRGIEKIEAAFACQKWMSFFDGVESATMSHHPAMVLNWYKSYCVLWNREPILVRASSGARQVVYPLEKVQEVWKGLSTHLLTPLGGVYNFDFQDPLVSGPCWNQEESERFWAEFTIFVRQEVKDCDRVVLYRLRPEFSGDLSLAKESAVCPYIDLAGKKSLDEVLADCTGSHRGDVKRQIRRLAAKDNLSIRRFGVDDMVLAEDALQHFFVAYDEQWAPKGPHAFETPLGRSFLEGLLRDLLPTGMLHFSVLYCGVTPIHWHLGFVFRDRLYFYKLAGDRQWSNYSPGKVHTAFLIEHCINSGIRYFDFLYGDEAYKFNWTSTVYTLYRRNWWNGIHPVKRFVEETVRPSYRAIKIRMQQ
jgi:CelD/BcsL family acetyltransferase involved in cellulose biosynthesis